MTDAFQLYENPGWGSAIVEAQLASYALPYALVQAGGDTDEAAVQRAMKGVNPVLQVPALILPNGETMTETAAMTLYLADVTGSDALVPAPSSDERAAFLRWLVFLVAAVYPTFTFGDVPTRFVPPDVAEAYQARIIDHRKAMWGVMEDEAALRRGPWFLGGSFTAIDLYLAMMTRWQPGEAWFRQKTPALWSAGERAAGRADVAPVMARNFPG